MAIVVKDVIRGNPVTFNATFYDEDNLITEVLGATLYIAYRVDNELQTANVAMSDAGNNLWTAVWSTAGVDEGQIDWSVQANTGVQVIVKDGSFRVLANEANQ